MIAEDGSVAHGKTFQPICGAEKGANPPVPSAMPGNRAFCPPRDMMRRPAPGPTYLLKPVSLLEHNQTSQQ